MSTPLIHRTQCVSFPRSGHHLLERLLHSYFGDERWRYCESYEDSGRTLDNDPETNFEKTHDLDLATEARDDRHYLVQIRYPIESLVSWYRWSCDRQGAEDSPGAWVNFAIQRSAFWMMFYRKWVLNHVPNRLIVNYADLVGAPAETVMRVVQFLGDDAPDRTRIEAICDAADIGVKHHFRGFKHYGPEFFNMLRWLYAAVPGVDIESDTLTVIESSKAPLASMTFEIRSVASQLSDLAGRIAAVEGGMEAKLVQT